MHGVYGIFSVKELEQKTAAELRPVGFLGRRKIPSDINVLQVQKLEVDLEKGEVVEVQ